MVNSERSKMQVRQSKVQYSSRETRKRVGGYAPAEYVQFPRITIAGLWLENLGFHIGDQLDVECGDGYLKISLADVGMVCDNDVNYQAEDSGTDGKNKMSGTKKGSRRKKEGKRVD